MVPMFSDVNVRSSARRQRHVNMAYNNRGLLARHAHHQRSVFDHYWSGHRSPSCLGTRFTGVGLRTMFGGGLGVEGYSLRTATLTCRLLQVILASGQLMSGVYYC